MGMGQRRIGNCDVTGGKKEPQVLGCDGLWEPWSPMHQPAPVTWSQNSTASAYVRWDLAKIGKERPSGKGRDGLYTGNADRSKGFQHYENNNDNHQDRRYLIDYTIELLRIPVVVGGKIFHPSGKQPMHGGENDDEGELRLQPARREPPVVRIGSKPGQPKPKHPGRDHCRIDDGAQETTL